MSTLAAPWSAGPGTGGRPAPTSGGHRVLTVARVQALDVVNFVALPWIVLGSAFAINLVIWVLVEEAAQGGTGGLSALYGYAAAMVAMMVARGFPYLLGMGVTRRAFSAGTGALLLAFSLVTGVLMTGFYLLEDATGGWGLGGRFFRVPWLTDLPLVQLPVLYALPMVFTIGVTALYATVWLRWRAIGSVALSVAIALLLVLGLWVLGLTEGWSAFGSWVVGLGPLGSMGVLAAVGALCAAGGWLTLRRAPA